MLNFFKSIYLSTEFLGGLPQVFGVFVKVTSFLAQENKEVALDVTVEDGAGSFLVEFNNQWQRFDLDELLQVVNTVLVSEFGFVVVKLLEKKDRTVFDAVFSKHIGVARDTENGIINGVGDFQEDLSFL